MKRYTKIRYDGETVELDWIEKHDGVTITLTLSSAEQPAPELPTALAAFKAFVLNLLPLRLEDADLEVRSVSLDEETKTGKRGLIVSAVSPIERANDRPFVINTPRLREAGDDEMRDGLYDEDVTLLIEELERAADAYRKGQRAQQEMFTADETTAKGAEAAAEKTNGSDPAKPPRVRRQRRVKEIEGAGRIENPEATVPPTDQELHKQILISGIDVPVERIAQWLSSEREAALAWALNPEGAAVPKCITDAAEQTAAV